jgi:hypothetical protein
VIPLSSLPDYVERGGEQVWRPPATARQVDLYGFVLSADQAAIDRMLLHDLVHPSAGAVDYRCAHPNVVVTFGEIGRESSLDPVDSKRGYISEREVSIWCLVADPVAGGRLLWYLPYIFTDSEQTVATGREIFGYPKQLGYFDDNFPAVLGPGGGATAVQALAIHPFAPNSAALKREMISVTRKPGAGTLPAQPSITDELELFFPGGFPIDHSRPSANPPPAAATITPVQAPPPAAARAAPPWLKGVLNAIQGRTLTTAPRDLIVDMVNDTTLVFLKQFRDVSCSTKACYQAVVEAPIAFDPVGASYASLDPGLFQLTLQSWDSDPIAEELGIPVGQPVVPQAAFHANFGFDIQLGLEVWRA